ncbi:MAG TPA: PBSX family phage terminase large subunit [Sphingomicrobium sp.]|nr:PBSX family phage terminase large subunit [Sphingomicrobium sp.]
MTSGLQQAPSLEQISVELLAVERELSRRRQEQKLVNNETIPEVFRPLLRPARYKGLYGGRGSAKSHTFAELLLARTLERPGTRWVCVREFQTTLEESVKRLLEDKIEEYQVGRYFRVMMNHIETPGAGRIIFQGMNNHTSESIKSLEGFDGAWFEEAQVCSERSLELLRPTIRKEYPDGTHSEIWFSWNPRFPKDPVDNLFRGNAPRSPELPPWQPVDDAIIIGSSYKENPHFPKVLLKEVKRDQARDPEKYAHVWLGGYERKSEARVFKNWEVLKVKDWPELRHDEVFYYGGDWGYSVDPTVLIRCFARGKVLYVDYEAYQVGCEIDHIPALFDKVPGCREWPVVADSARPETIAYLQRHGFPRLEAAIKGKDSVKEGVIFLQGYDIKVHPRCEKTIEELTMYSYKTDPQTDIVMPVLEDKKNHVIDSLRYAVEKLRKPKEWVTF